MLQVVSLTIALIVTAAGVRSACADPPGRPPVVYRTSNTASARSSVSQPPFHFRGARSCAATACHGDAEAPAAPSAAWRRAFTTWVERDPHAQAGRSLESPLATQIYRRLGIAAGRGHSGCVACHDPAPAPPQRTESWFAEGVGCEQCHGPSDAWIGRHHTWGGSREAIARLGMRDTANLNVRAGLCADCHVGGPGREVNHDLLAAGHPPLQFELAAFLEKLPKHWDENRERIVTENFELRTWVAGQQAAAEAALTLLQDRAARAQAGSATWPEFAEYDCNGCHRPLGAIADSGRWLSRESNSDDLSWGQGSVSRFERLSSSRHNSLSPFSTAIASLRSVMEASSAADPDEVQGAAATALAVRVTMARQPIEVLESLLANRETLDPDLLSGGADAAQVYLAFVAVDRAYHDERRKSGKAATEADRRLTVQLMSLRDALAFRSNAEALRRVFDPMNSVYDQLRARASRDAIAP